MQDWLSVIQHCSKVIQYDVINNTSPSLSSPPPTGSVLGIKAYYRRAQALAARGDCDQAIDDLARARALAELPLLQNNSNSSTDQSISSHDEQSHKPGLFARSDI